MSNHSQIVVEQRNAAQSKYRGFELHLYPALSKPQHHKIHLETLENCLSAWCVNGLQSTKRKRDCTRQGVFGDVSPETQGEGAKKKKNR